MTGDTLPAFQAVDDYLDDLLADTSAPPSAPAMAEDVSWPPSSDVYLMCSAANIRVAMPMSQIADIVPTPLAHGDEFDADDGSAAGRRVRVIDLSGILTDDLRESAADMLVVFKGWRWAAACRSAEPETSRILHGDVHWRVARAERIRRPWLGGMLHAGNCLVLDVVALLDMLEREHQGRHHQDKASR